MRSLVPEKRQGVHSRAIYDLLPKEAKTINQAYVVRQAQANNAIDAIKMLSENTIGRARTVVEESSGSSRRTVLACVATAILVHGQKCITHLDTLLTRSTVRRKLIDHSSRSQELLEAIVNVWEGSQNAKIAVDRISARGGATSPLSPNGRA